MKLLRNLDNLPEDLTGGAVAIGNFDGVHRGHARIAERLIAQAQQAGGPALVLTFDPHPVRLLRPTEAPSPLTWTDRKAALLAELGVDAVIAYPTDENMLSRTPESFFEFFVRDCLQARAMVEGPNFFFGKDRAGDIDVLERLCDNAGVILEVVQPLLAGGEYISSSRIRNLLLKGEVATAAELLTRPYRIRGMVAHGVGRGAKIGFPTANLQAIDTLLPSPGVYAAHAVTGNETRSAAVHIGPNPTFGEQVLKVEVHLLDFSGSLYGAPLEVDFLERLRDIQSFDSVEALKKQLALDVQQARAFASR